MSHRGISQRTALAAATEVLAPLELRRVLRHVHACPQCFSLYLRNALQDKARRAIYMRVYGITLTRHQRYVLARLAKYAIPLPRLMKTLGTHLGTLGLVKERKLIVETVKRVAPLLEATKPRHARADAAGAIWDCLQRIAEPLFVKASQPSAAAEWALSLWIRCAARCSELWARIDNRRERAEANILLAMLTRAIIRRK